MTPVCGACGGVLSGAECNRCDVRWSADMVQAAREAACKVLTLDYGMSVPRKTRHQQISAAIEREVRARHTQPEFPDSVHLSDADYRAAFPQASTPPSPPAIAVMGKRVLAFVASTPVPPVGTFRLRWVEVTEAPI